MSGGEAGERVDGVARPAAVEFDGRDGEGVVAADRQ